MFMISVNIIFYRTYSFFTTNEVFWQSCSLPISSRSKKVSLISQRITRTKECMFCKFNVKERFAVE